jgi:hypothetical protein
MPKIKTTPLDPHDVNLSSIDFAIDTSGSWDGSFPDLDEGDYLVEINNVEGEEPEHVLVSRRYTSPTDADDAATIALDAYAERHGCAAEDLLVARVSPIKIRSKSPYTRSRRRA